MEKRYLAKIIANDNEGLQTISACCSGAKIKISNIKYLQSNKIFLISLERKSLETGDDKKIVEKLNQLAPKINDYSAMKLLIVSN